MMNKLGKEIKLYKVKSIDFDLKYKWIRGAQKVVKDIEKCKAFYECPFTDIPETPGVYLFCFPDSSYYVGQSVNLAGRFTEHFYKFFSPKCTDWHSYIGLRSWNRTKIYMQQYCNYFYMELPQEELDRYEQSALAQIVKNNMTDKYYNTIFYKEEKEE